eukprot:COSAG01_NODE_965_length_12401_cov_3.496098_2_plen_82_part_00
MGVNSQNNVCMSLAYVSVFKVVARPQNPRSSTLGVSKSSTIPHVSPYSPSGSPSSRHSWGRLVYSSPSLEQIWSWLDKIYM